MLKDLSLWDKKDDKIMTLSGGMKRRVMIAKALSHEPRILFLDEPTAGVDVELRKDMWEMVRALRASGVTIILTTHYIEEAEQMADRVGVINKGEIILVEDKAELMRKLGQKAVDAGAARADRGGAGCARQPSSDACRRRQQARSTPTTRSGEHTGITGLARRPRTRGIAASRTCIRRKRSLEEIFVGLVRKQQ